MAIYLKLSLPDLYTKYFAIRVFDLYLRKNNAK